MAKDRIKEKDSKMWNFIINNIWALISIIGLPIMATFLANIFYEWAELIIISVFVILSLFSLIIGWSCAYNFLKLPKRPKSIENLIFFEMNYKPHSRSDNNIGVTLNIQNWDWEPIELIEANLNTLCDEEAIGETKKWHSSYDTENEEVHGISITKKIKPCDFGTIELMYPLREFIGEKFYKWSFTGDIKIKCGSREFIKEISVNSILWEERKRNKLLRFVNILRNIDGNGNPPRN